MVLADGEERRASFASGGNSSPSLGGEVDSRSRLRGGGGLLLVDLTLALASMAMALKPLGDRPLEAVGLTSKDPALALAASPKGLGAPERGIRIFGGGEPKAGLKPFTAKLCWSLCSSG